MRRTKEDAEKTRLAILEAAERLFLERGVAHTSLDVIAREAGVTRGAVYWHFQNKAHLFHEMLSQVRLPPEQLTERLCHCGNDDPLRSLYDLSVEVIANLAQDEKRRRIFTILLHRCEFTEELKEAEERHYAFVDLFIQLTERLFEHAAARLRPGITPRIASRSLHGLVVGLFTDFTRDPAAYDPATDAAALISPLFHGLVADWQDAQATS